MAQRNDRPLTALDVVDIAYEGPRDYQRAFPVKPEPSWVEAVTRAAAAPPGRVSQSSALMRVLEQQRREQAQQQRDAERQRERQQQAAEKERERLLRNPDAFMAQALQGVPRFEADETLPYSEQSKQYDEYAQRVTDALTAANPNLDPDDVRYRLGEHSPPPKKPERGFFRTISDAFIGIGQGLTGFLQMGTTVKGLIDDYNPIRNIPAFRVGGQWMSQNDLRDATGRRAFGPGGAVTEGLGAVSEFLQQGESEKSEDNVKQREFERRQLEIEEMLSGEERGVGRALWDEAKIAITNVDPRSAGELVGNILPSIVMTGGVGAIAQAGVRGATTAAARTALEASSKQLMTTTVALTGTVMGAGDAQLSAYQALMEQPLSKFKEFEHWQDALTRANGDEQKAKAFIANDLSHRSALLGGIVGLGFSMLPGDIEKTVVNYMGKQQARKLARRVMGSLPLNTLHEGLEESLTQIAGNIGTAGLTGDYSARALTEGAGEAGALGALGGGLGGGVASAAGRLVGRQGAAEEAQNDPSDILGLAARQGSPTPTPPPPLRSRADPRKRIDPRATLEPARALTAEEVETEVELRTPLEMATGPAREAVRRNRSRLALARRESAAQQEISQQTEEERARVAAEVGVADMVAEQAVADAQLPPEQAWNNLRPRQRLEIVQAAGLPKSAAGRLWAGLRDAQREALAPAIQTRQEQTREQALQDLVAAMDAESSLLEADIQGATDTAPVDTAPAEPIDPQQAWDALRPAQRETVAARAGVPMHTVTREWAGLRPNEQTQLAEGLQTQRQQEAAQRQQEAAQRLSEEEQRVGLDRPAQRPVRRAGGLVDETLATRDPADNMEISFQRREQPTDGGMMAEQVQAVVQRMTAEWENAPDILIINDLQDTSVPQAVRDADARQREAGGTGTPAGFFADGAVYVVAPMMRNEADVVETVAHEVLGHAGLRGLFGEELVPILDDVAAHYAPEVERRAQQYGLDMNDQTQRRQAAEEVLAFLAQEQPELNLVQRAINAIREWLRKVLPNLSYSQSELVEKFIIPAREFIQNAPLSTAPAAQTADGDAAFQRRAATPPPLPATPPPLPTGREQKEAVAAVQHAHDRKLSRLPKLDNEDLQRRAEMTAPDLIEQLEAGRAAPSATPVRAVMQAAKAKDWDKTRGLMHAGLDAANTAFHDSLAPVKRWIQSLPVVGRIQETLENTLYAAPGIRDNHLREAQELYGGKQLQALLGDFVHKYGKSEETIVQLVGHWVTAQRAPEANKRLLMRDLRAIETAQKIKNENQRDEAVKKATREYRRRLLAIQNTNITTRKHAAGVAGFSDAQALAVQKAVEKQIKRDDLEKAAAHIYKLNAWALMTNIETGKADAGIASYFLTDLISDADERTAERQRIADLLQRLKSAVQNVRAADEASVRALEALRKETVEAVSSNYVPLTGQLDFAQDLDVFSTQEMRNMTPNVARDFSMYGRTEGVPDDGVTTTLTAVLRAASYAGWSPFQDAIAEAYAHMNEEQRQEAGLFRETLAQSAPPPADSLIRRRGERMEVYTFANNGLLEAIRGSNRDDTSAALRVLGAPTRAFSYMATQFNLAFAPKNFVRDVWERSELIRAREIRDANGNLIDGNSLGRGIWKQVVGKLLRLMRATSHFSFRGNADISTYEGRMLNELLRLGGSSMRADLFAADRPGIIKGIKKRQGYNSRPWHAIGQFIERYNRTFDMVSALATFITLSEHGATPQTAAAQTLDLMNFRKKGTNMGLARALYAFSQPAVMGGANALYALYNPRTRKVNPRALARLAGATLVYTALISLFRSMFGDDEGGNRYDQLSDYTKDSSLSIPIGDGYVKVPLAFGLTRVAHGFARNFVEMTVNTQTPMQALGNFADGTVLANFTPIETSDISWREHPAAAFMTLVAPSWLKPVVGLASNLNTFGSPIVQERFMRDDQFRSEQGSPSTPDFYKEVARSMRSLGLDLAPEEVRYMLSAYPTGSLRMAQAGLIDNPTREKLGRPTTNPLISQFYASYTNGGLTSQFYEAKEATQKVIRKINAGETLSEEERRLQRWRDEWDKIDSDLTNRTRRLNRDKTLSESARNRRRAAIAAERDRRMREAVYRWRVLQGKHAERVTLPSAWVR